MQSRTECPPALLWRLPLLAVRRTVAGKAYASGRQAGRHKEAKGSEMSKHTLTHSNCPACAEEFGMMQHQLHTLRAQNRDLLAALEAMTPDYEHCAPDMSGDI